MTEIDLKKVVHKNLLIVPSKSKSKSEVIQELGNLLVSKGYVSNAQELGKVLQSRMVSHCLSKTQQLPLPS